MSATEKKMFQLHFEFVEGTSNKFWEGAILRRVDHPAEGPDSISYIFQARYGRRGSTGSVDEKTAPTISAVEALLRKKIFEKKKKGYRCRSTTVDWAGLDSKELAVNNRLKAIISDLYPEICEAAAPESPSPSPATPSAPKETSIQATLRIRRESAQFII